MANRQINSGIIFYDPDLDKGEFEKVEEVMKIAWECAGRISADSKFIMPDDIIYKIFRTLAEVTGREIRRGRSYDYDEGVWR